MQSLRVGLSGIVKQVVFLCLCFSSVVHAEVLTLSPDQRPDWLSRDGDWLILNKEGKPRIPEWKGSEYRYFWDRNNLTFKGQAGLVTFTVPDVKIYEIAVVTMK